MVALMEKRDLVRKFRERNEQIGQNTEQRITGDVFDEMAQLGLNFTVKQDRVLVEFFGSTANCPRCPQTVIDHAQTILEIHARKDRWS